MTLKFWKINPFRQKLAFYLEDIETPLGRGITLAIAILVVLSTAIFVTETYPIPASVRDLLDLINNLILSLFTLEYLLRLWCADHKLKHLFKLYSIVDLIAILPFLFRAFDISFIRIFRWFRILRLIRLIDNHTLLGRFSTADDAIVLRILFTLFAIIFVYSGLIYQVEHPLNSENFQSFFDAVYFSVVTMTTVGFGDVTPISQQGRLLTVLMILTGIALIPTQLGQLIKQFAKTANQQEIPCESCGLSFHDADAKFCKRCGTVLNRFNTSPSQK